ncbi:MAG TPA: carbon-nitrogen hydrolase family protein [Nitrososphaeraceae archaeon]|nr:carbon-nitrogen hydrolase family protein [Nitrososphaeraceae archaeon]
MSELCRIAVVQMKSDTDKKKNLAQSKDYIKEARYKNAQIVCFPEFQMGFSPSYQKPIELSGISEAVNTGNFVKSLSRCAKENKIDIISTIYEKTRANNKVFDSAVAIRKDGIIIARYRKIHLYDALGFRESDKFLAGSSIEKPFRFEAAKIGLMICYDIRFPEVSRILSVLGAELLVIPSAWVHGIMKEEHWQTFIKARAIENGIYVIAPDQIGNIYTGRSMVVDPFGTVLLDMGNKEGMEVVELEKSDIIKVREKLPLLKNRRTDVYQKNLFAFVSQ